jgi:selenide,water dikinase
MAPGSLAQVLRQLPTSSDENLLTAAIPFADAGVYRLNEACALVQSVDFFTPIVNDPRTYGRIAAANALSDIYAMGGRPLTALNLVGFPPCLEHGVLIEILQGGAEKVQEAGAVIIGGHTVEDDEPKYGLAVTGLVDPSRLVSTMGAQPGDILILTKPLGTGILATALKGEMVQEQDLIEPIRSMEQLNGPAAKVMLDVGVHACTDITGFGLLGHVLELAEASQVGIEIDSSNLHIHPMVMDFAAIGLIPAGSYRNRDYYLPKVIERESVKPEIVDILADPQTSGGLLIATPPENKDVMLAQLNNAGCFSFVVGHVTSDHPGQLRVR